MKKERDVFFCSMRTTNPHDTPKNDCTILVYNLPLHIFGCKTLAACLLLALGHIGLVFFSSPRARRARPHALPLLALYDAALYLTGARKNGGKDDEAAPLPLLLPTPPLAGGRGARRGRGDDQLRLRSLVKDRETKLQIEIKFFSPMLALAGSACRLALANRRLAAAQCRACAWRP